MAVTHKRLSNWFGMWEQIIKDREDLLLGRTVPKLINALLSALRKQKVSKEWKNGLVQLLTEIIDADDAVIRFIRVEHGPAVDQLRQLLRKSVNQPKEDKQQTDEQVCAILDIIKNAPSEDLLKRELKTELLAESDTDGDRLFALTGLILGRAITRHDEAVFKNLPEKFFSRNAAEYLLEDHTKSFAKDLQLRAVLGNWQDAFSNKLTTKKVWSYVKKEPSSLLDLFDSRLWPNMIRDLIDELPKQFMEALHGVVKGDAKGAISISEQAGVGNKLGRSMLGMYVRAFLRQIFDIFTESEAEKKGSPLLKTAGSIARYLAEKGEFIDRRPWGRKQNTAYVTSLAAEALADATSQILPDILCEAIIENGMEPLALEIGDRLIGSFTANNIALDLAGGLLSDEHIYWISVNWFARKGVQQDIAKMLLPLNEKIIEGLDRLLRNEDEMRLADRSIDATLFWDKWKTAFSQPKWSSETLFEYVPWSQVTEKQLGRMVDKLFEFLLPTSTKFLVVFKVKGITPDEPIWSTGGITFYDPDTFDYGEGSCLLFRERWPEGDDLTYAKIVVDADTFEVAWEVAQQALNNALNALSFALSAGVEAGGFKPQIINECFIVRLSPRRRSFKAGKQRAEMSMTQSAKGHKIPEIAKGCDRLLTLSTREPDRLTPLQFGFLRALHWYRKGRWEPDFAERFLFYWVGLEHLFTGGEFRPGAIFENAPNLHITWQNWQGFYWVGLSFNAIIKNIEENEELRAKVAATPELREWRSDTRILLQPDNLRLLARLTPSSIPQVKEFFERTAGEFEEKAANKEAYEKLVEHLRKLFLFKLNLLSDLRNEMVHEAKPYRVGIRLYAEALEDILEDILRKMAGVATQETPKYRTIEELAEWHQFPWQQNNPLVSRTADAIRN
jgi:hypothetical protein